MVDEPRMHEKSNDTDELIRLSFFTDMAKSIAAATTFGETLEQVMDNVNLIFAPRNWSMLLLDCKTNELIFTLVTGNQKVKELQNRRIPADKGIAGWIASTGRSIIIEDVSDDDRFDHSIDEVTGFKTESIIGVPLKTSNRVFGVIELINKLNGDRFTPLDLKILTTIADFAAIAIEKAYYFKALHRVATLDALTEVYNRRAFYQIIDREMERCRRLEREMAALMIDIDDFKEINDKKGHAAGDEVLRETSRILQRNVRKVDYVFRYGGDEFIILMPDTTLAIAEEVKKRINAAMEFDPSRRELVYSASIGTYSGCPKSADELFDKVDAELYAEKDRKKEASIADLAMNIGDIIEETEQN